MKIYCFNSPSKAKERLDKLINISSKYNISKPEYEDVLGERMFRYFYSIWDKFRYKNKDKSEIVVAAIYTYKGEHGEDKKYVYKLPELEKEILTYNFKTIEIKTGLTEEK
ncbi:hypothetical protein SR42_00115 [Clostridium botulinum]|uniref:hypothetical protein n=1 Tax=Clostridium botulinum TaxID=1491 RepID=UPI000596B0BC|nr:hypothetical protein [Clostridium botulinum]KIL07496.1 hypothetical protein SR42_00115 [Clostridium botulinum]